VLRLVSCVILLAGQTDARKQIQAQYDRWSKAYMAKDVATLLAILSPSYTLTAFDKSVLSYGTYTAYLRLRSKAPKDTTKYATHIRKLNVRGTVAEVDSVETMTTVSGALQSTHRHEYLDRWRLSEAVWRLESTKTLKESTSTTARQ
jgi:hypothetical protein